MLRACTAELIVGPQSVTAVHRRRSTSHIDGKSDRLDHLLTTGSLLMGHFSVIGDAALTVDCDPDRERHEFLRFRVDRIRSRCRRRESTEGLYRVWRSSP